MSEIPRPPAPAKPANPAPSPSAAPAPAAGESPAPAAAPSELTPEEQMEKFAQELKETDWGHQPC